jgi:hypothetical protein
MEKILPLVASRDARQVVVPKGSSLPAKVLNWSLDQFAEYTKECGFELAPSESLVNEFKRVARGSIKSIVFDLPIIKHQEAIEPEPGKMLWLGNDSFPRDLVFKDKPFLKLEDPVDPQDGKDVFGRPIRPKCSIKLPAIHLDLDSAFTKTHDGLIVSSKHGQCVLEGKKLRFSHVYHVEDASLLELQDVVFPCGVKVIRELAGGLRWVVNGKLEVNGHFSAAGVEVFGDVVCHSGIQTNSDEPVRIHGNCQANYIQMSKIGVLGDLYITQTILQSEVRVGGNIECIRGRGAVMGSTVAVFGGFNAHQAGSDRGRATRLEFFYNPLKPKRSVRLLAEGTELISDGVQITIKSDREWNNGV